MTEPKQNGPTSVASKRILRELEDITKNPPPNCTAGLDESGENLFRWKAIIVGPQDTPYENGIFKLAINFTEDYPFKPPVIKFETKIYHCNINSLGNICLDVLKYNWSPALTVSKILLSVSSLLAECNPDDPLVPSIAVKYREDKETHNVIARLWTTKFASKK